ncbi:heme-binding protein [Hydrogenovibrio crunogenus]|uniref:Heme-binding protein n=1 Tax=Hydrogenovibrio crunogenus TaxID=39765 RepID=A0A4P7NXA8_9GAMM|nr:heme-binding protein [Hydrogenovibrio crunogenus]QBZ82266.1 heme-binding protein [Hydrogenovibrio crunogenus]
MKISKVIGMFLFVIMGHAFANDVVTTKTIGLGIANDIAMSSILACRKQGYQVSAVVVDRNGVLRSAMRDDLAPRFTLQIAQEKANMVVMSGIKSGVFRQLRADIRPELNHIDGLIVMEGGVPIKAAGVRIGAVGVSGAPGGEKDEVCAAKGIESVQERLDFAE